MERLTLHGNILLFRATRQDAGVGQAGASSRCRFYCRLYLPLQAAVLHTPLPGVKIAPPKRAHAPYNTWQQTGNRKCAVDNPQTNGAHRMHSSTHQLTDSPLFLCCSFAVISCCSTLLFLIHKSKTINQISMIEKERKKFPCIFS